MKSEISTKTNRLPLLMLLCGGAAILLMLVLALWMHVRLEGDVRIPIHWNAKGEVDGYAGKAGLWFIPGIAAFELLVLLIVPRFEPRRGKQILHSVPYAVIVVMSMVLMLGIQVGIVVAATGREFPMVPVVCAMVGILFLVIGNFLGKVRSNFIMGVRTPWTLSSELSWSKTHRLAGRLFALLGLVMIVMAGLPVREGLWVWILLGGIVVLIGVTFTYSYLVWKNDPHRQGFGAE